MSSWLCKKKTITKTQSYSHLKYSKYINRYSHVRCIVLKIILHHFLICFDSIGNGTRIANSKIKNEHFVYKIDSAELDTLNDRMNSCRIKRHIFEN